MSEVRERIRAHVAANPGEHFNALARALDLASGQTQYHLRRLERRDRVVSLALYGRTHYFTPAYDEWQRGAIAVLRRETARDVLLSLLDGGAAAPGDVADDVGIARSTLSWHVGHLVEQGLVEKRRDDRNRVTLVACEPAETVALLEELTPTLPERLADRFTRLVDDVLRE
jgi:predicted transcriptional regulator